MNISFNTITKTPVMNSLNKKGNKIVSFNKSDNNDSFEHSSGKLSSKNNAISGFSKAALAATIVYMVLLGNPKLPEDKNSCVQIMNYETFSRFKNSYSILEVPKDIIVDYNQGVENMKRTGKVKIPQMYSNIETQIQSLDDDLQADFIEFSSKKSMETKLEALQQKYADQQKLADVYCDDDYVYYKLHLEESESKYVKEKDSGNYVITGENFKKIFDIKDGALKKYNRDKLDFENKTSSNENNAVLKNGETYKISKKSVNTKNINLDDYIITNN